MRHTTIFVLAFLFTVNAAFAGPLQESARRAAIQAAQPTQQGSKRSGGKALLWTGVSLAGGGVALMLFGRESCETISVGNISGSVVTCTSRPGLKWLGLGMAGGGAALATVGAAKRHQVVVRPNAVAYRVRF